MLALGGVFGNARVFGMAADVSKPREVQELVGCVRDALGAVRILVNAAGVQPPIGRLIDVDAEDWVRSVEVNLCGTMLAARRYCPR